MNSCTKCSSELDHSWKFCPSCGEKVELIQKERRCNNCSYVNEGNSNFCQECGNSLTTSVVHDSAVPEFGITIQFKDSKSQSFKDALAAARTHASFKIIGHKNPIYRLNVLQNEIESIHSVIQNLARLRGKEVFINGEAQDWSSIFRYMSCFKKRSSSFKPQLHCFGYDAEWNYNIWGCMYSGLEFTSHSKIWRYGKWVGQSGQWKFDKKKIKFELERNLYDFKLCPSINFDLIQKIIAVFPENVNPHLSDNWTFQRAFGDREKTALKVVIDKKGWKQEEYYECPIPIDFQKFAVELFSDMKIELPSGFAMLGSKS